MLQYPLSLSSPPLSSVHLKQYLEVFRLQSGSQQYLQTHYYGYDSIAQFFRTVDPLHHCILIICLALALETNQHVEI